MTYKSRMRMENEMKESESPTRTETAGPETKNGIVARSLIVKVREKPSFESRVLEILQKGDKVTILGKGSAFYKISTRSDIIGYIALNFVKEE